MKNLIARDDLYFEFKDGKYEIVVFEYTKIKHPTRAGAFIKKQIARTVTVLDAEMFESLFRK